VAEAGAWRRTRRPALPFAATRLLGVARAAAGHWDVLAAYLVAALAGVAAGLSLAAGGLALAGRSLLDLPAETAEAVLVAGPLLGLLPLAGIVLVASRRRAVAGHLPFLLFLWLGAALLAAGLLGLRPLLR
jgi:hypothetical protein